MDSIEDRWHGIDQADLSRGIPQCPYVWPLDTDEGYLNCCRVAGHDGPHMDGYGYRHDDNRWYPVPFKGID